MGNILLFLGEPMNYDEMMEMAQAVSKSYDISDIKYTDPIVEYLEGEKK